MAFSIWDECFFDFYTSLDRRGEAYNSDPVICGIAGPREPTAIPTIRTGKKSIQKLQNNRSPSRRNFQEEVHLQVSESDIQCSKRNKSVADDFIDICVIYDESDSNLIETEVEIHGNADDSPLRESYASQTNENKEKEKKRKPPKCSRYYYCQSRRAR